MEEEFDELKRLGRVGGDKWKYEFIHIDPRWRGSTTTYHGKAEKFDNHYVLTYWETGHRDVGGLRTIGVEEATPEGVLNSDKRIRERVLVSKQFSPNAPLVERILEDVEEWKI